MQLMNINEIKGKITLTSGLHIGAGDTEMHIGGTDNPVIKHPHTQEPYIPGSSLKGKVRSLLEMRSGLMVLTDGKPLQAGQLKRVPPEKREEARKIIQLFGSGSSDAEAIAELGPTRVSFADCHLNEEWRKEARERRLALLEVKSENAIDRIRGVAKDPRFTERVPAGVVFDFRVSLRRLGPDEDLLDFLLEGIRLLEMDALGGSGSRGYGRVRFTFDDDDIRRRFEGLKPFAEGGREP